MPVLIGVKGQPADTLIVHFAFNKSVLMAGDRKAIDNRLAHAGPRLLSIGLSGFCDSMGADRYNDSLSAERIQSVKAYLQTMGMPDTVFRLLQPYGRRRPLNDNGDEEKRSLNRRVMIVWRTVTIDPGPDTSFLTHLLRDSAAFVGKYIMLNVQFYRDTHFPIAASFRVLHVLLNFMKAHPALRIEIQGHVCCWPDDKDGFDEDTKSYDLSKQRAKFVYDYLADHGIDKSRLSFRGLGGANKVYPDEINDFQKLANRRVEIMILSWNTVN